MTLDALAEAYGTDPYTVLTTWGPARLGFNLACRLDGNEERRRAHEEAVRRAAMVRR